MNGGCCAKPRARVRHAVPILRKRRSGRCPAGALASRSSSVVTWAQAGMPVLLFFIHEGQPVVSHSRRFYPEPCFFGCKKRRGTGDPADLCHDEESSNDDRDEGWGAARCKSLHA